MDLSSARGSPSLRLPGEPLEEEASVQKASYLALLGEPLSLLFYMTRVGYSSKVGRWLTGQVGFSLLFGGQVEANSKEGSFC